MKFHVRRIFFLSLNFRLRLPKKWKWFDKQSIDKYLDRRHKLYKRLRWLMNRFSVSHKNVRFLMCEKHIYRSFVNRKKRGKNGGRDRQKKLGHQHAHTTFSHEIWFFLFLPLDGFFMVFLCASRNRRKINKIYIFFSRTHGATETPAWHFCGLEHGKRKK